jgi:putative Mg2+ transporter-C (MgtC) family protein
MNTWWQGVVENFTDVPDLAGAFRLIVRLLLAALLGGLLGYDRERAGKPAGLRTHMLVSLGAALFVLVPMEAGMSAADLSRVIQGVVTGIGFLGAGAIIKLSEQGQVRGLTTAAGIWLTAAVGIAAGMGKGTTAVLGTVLAFLILSVLHRIERRVRAGLPEKAYSEHHRQTAADGRDEAGMSRGL